MLGNSQHPEYKIRLVACDFWSQAARSAEYSQGIEQVLPELVPILLKNMQYSEADYLNMYDRDDDAQVTDHSQDIQPRFHHSKRDGEGSRESPRLMSRLINSRTRRPTCESGIMM